MLLERESLVVTRLNRPAVVRKPSPDEIKQIYTIRSALEGVAARWAADHATPALVSELEQKAEALNRATVADLASADSSLISMAIDFHTAIARASGSGELQRMLQSLCNQIKLVMTAGLASLTNRRAQEIHAEHLGLIAAIAERDGDRAEQLAAAHVRGARDRLVYLSDSGVRSSPETDQ